jgi:hypothetical protein
LSQTSTVFLATFPPVGEITVGDFRRIDAIALSRSIRPIFDRNPVALPKPLPSRLPPR